MNQTLRQIRARLGVSDFAWGSALSLVWLGVGTLLSFANQAIMSRRLGEHEFGTYLYALGWMNVGVVFALLQLETVTSRFASVYIGTNDAGKLRGLVKKSQAVVVLVAIPISIVAVAIGWYLHREEAPHRQVTWTLAGLLITVTSLISLHGAALQAFRRVTRFQFISSVVRPALMTLLLLSMSSWAIWDSAAAGMAVNSSAAVITLLIARRFVAAEMRKVAPAVPQYDTRLWVGTGLGLMVTAVAQLILSQSTDTLVVGTLLDKSSAAHYGIASQLSGLVAMAVTAVTTLAVPMLARHHGMGERKELQEALRRFGRLNLLLAVPVLIVLILGGKSVLRVFGPNYSAAYPVLIILTALQLINAAGGAQAGWLLSMSGNEKVLGVVVASSAALNLLLSVILTPQYGIVGAASATLVATLLRAIVLGAVGKRRLGMSVLPWGG